MKHITATIPELIQLATLAYIRATTACSLVDILDDDPRHAQERVSDFRYVVREIREVMAYLEQQLQWLEGR